ncbi:MAG: lipid-A-disaccharide synthase [Terracidiphilus sp.]|nr:lipid-A-disaccharide synthase [Terracidiphilus sp.]MDR3797346.1 lipid-A-disaccharide synthase [Terracidiphilus sp.]
MTPSIFISAGEASGELYGALLASALSHGSAPRGKTTEWGMGGPRMAAAGVEIVVRSEDMAVMGFTEIVRHLPRIYREFRKLECAIRQRRPTVAVLIDFPEIHFRLAQVLHRLGIPVIYFVSPQLWAWKPKRIKQVQRYVKRMLVIFPFEEKYYRERGVEAEFVGHPLADLPPPAITREQFAAENGLDPARTWIGILPGSRLKEIEANLPEMLAAARGLKDVPPGLKSQSYGGEDGTAEAVPFQSEGTDEVFQRPEQTELRGLKPLAHGAAVSARLNSRPDTKQSSGVAGGEPPTNAGGEPPRDAGGEPRRNYEFLIPLAPTLDAAQRRVVLHTVEKLGGGLSVRLVEDARAALFHARASVVASGTATVEAALIGNPFVVVYRVSRLTYAIARRLVKVPHVAMANLIAGKRVVPELIQQDFTAANIVQHLSQLLPDGPARESMMKELGAIREALHVHQTAGRAEHPGAIETVAAIVAGEVEAASPAAQETAQP